MTSWLNAVTAKVASAAAVVRVVVVQAEGSTPREAGAAMVVTADGIEGTIGGGALEHNAIRTARDLIKNCAHLSAMSKGASNHASSKPGGDQEDRQSQPAMWRREIQSYPLGPSLAQCCGGYTKVLFELFTEAEITNLTVNRLQDHETGLVIRPVRSGVPLELLVHRREGFTHLPLNVLRVTRDMLSGARPVSACLVPGRKGEDAFFIEPASRALTPLYLYGAGHVGRALIRVLDRLPFAITWVDTHEERFPDDTTPGIIRVVSRDPVSSAMPIQRGAIHLVMTYSHPLDLAICHAILKLGEFRFLGLIGSQTKRARFIKRLRELGHDQSSIDRLVCPIGIAGLPGKEPATIAISVAAQLLQTAVARDESALPGVFADKVLG